jgi:PAS domain S-box-containing protein
MDAARLKSELFIAFEKATAFTRRAFNMFGARPPHNREISRENGLQLLLTISPDPVVVIDGEHRFVDANTKALDLFGISKTNLVKFTIDTFLSYKAIAKCDRYRSAFVRRPEKHGKCEIRRLDGSLRPAEYIYIPNFVRFRHLFRFRDVNPRVGSLAPPNGRKAGVCE